MCFTVFRRCYCRECLKEVSNVSCSEKKKNCEYDGCIEEILDIICRLQNCSDECESIHAGCSKPFLGPTPSLVCFNTRPIRLFRCLDGGIWSLPYTYNGTSGTSDVFRIESLDCGCATCRILIPNPDTTSASPYIASDSYCTFKTECIGAISCLADISVPNI